MASIFNERSENCGGLDSWGSGTQQTEMKIENLLRPYNIDLSCSNQENTMVTVTLIISLD